MIWRRALLFLLATQLAHAQSNGSLAGKVTDDTGALIQAATIVISGPNAVTRSVKAGLDGTYAFPDLPSGAYTVRASAQGLAQYQNVTVAVAAGARATADIVLKTEVEKQQVTVRDTANTTLSTDPAANASSLVLRGEDLQALPDDPDDLAQDLQALAGPSAGPNGGQIYIDGFTNGRMPPKESIREIRINQNPFSAEYDRLGFGRIEILTKPGSDKFHGQGSFNISDGTLNSRNPFAGNKAPFESKRFGGNVSGPIGKRASFFLDVERRSIDDAAVINANVIDPSSLTENPFSQAVLTPQRRTTVSPRIDYQLTGSNTLMGRYTWTTNDQDNSGIGDFSLLSRGYNSTSTEQTVQITETAILNSKIINESRFQFTRGRNNEFGNNSQPALDVLQSFSGGGAPIGRASTEDNRYEFQNYTSIAQGAHTIRFGARLRAVSLTDLSPSNFGGTFTFAGGSAPVLDSNNNVIIDPATGQPKLEQITSLDRYRRTLLHLTGGGASQFSIAGGNPLAAVGQVDLGFFAQDDWRVRPNFTLSLGLRYETQTNIHDRRDIAPRVGFAWAPGQIAKTRPKTVIRGGFGVFYDRFGETSVLAAERYNGETQQQYVVSNPGFFPNVPSIASLQAARQPQTIDRIDSALRAPYIVQSAIGVERQLPRNTTASVTFTNSRALHLLRTRNINAPLSGSGVRPYGDVGNIYLYESSGVLNQNQIIANVNSRISRKFTLFTGYVYNRAKSNTDGISSFPADQYNLAGEYGRAAIDVHHRMFLGGSFTAPWAVRLSPFVVAHSGAPFNITTGHDLNLDSVFTDRPAFATDPNKPGLVQTAYGLLDPNPGPGEKIIPRNFGDSPGFFSVNLRASRTFGFGGARKNASAAPDSGGPDRRGGGGGGGGRGGGSGMRMGGGGMGGMFSDTTTEQRYNLTLLVSARNLLNHLNPGTPIGNLSSPIFGTSNSLAGGFGPERQAANNRRIEFQLRFVF